MLKYVIQGGKPLHGEINISGAKNAAVAILPATLLVNGPCRIENIPQISDVTLILEILQELGARVRTINRSTVEIDCSKINRTDVSYELIAPVPGFLLFYWCPAGTVWRCSGCNAGRLQSGRAAH